MPQYIRKTEKTKAVQWRPGKKVKGVVPIHQCHGISPKWRNGSCNSHYRADHGFPRCSVCGFTLQYDKVVCGEIEINGKICTIQSGEWLVKGEPRPMSDKRFKELFSKERIQKVREQTKE